MPLSTPAARELAHTRVVTCKGYEREDGLWDIEGHIVDTKPFSFPNKDRGGKIEADEALHNMWIRLTIDLEMKIHAAEQSTDFAPYHYCHEIEHFCQNLVGHHIAPGWTRKAKGLMGASKGCTHLTELLGPVATTAYQTLVKVQFKKAAEAKAKGHDAQAAKKAPGYLGTCHALQFDSPVIKEHFPQFYKGGV